MNVFDLIFRQANLVGSDFQQVSDLGVSGGIIASIAPSISASARREIDASGHYLLPGYIDAHVHLNEPGRAEWEGFATGTAALAAGGCTAFLDMPLNSTPPVLDAASFHAKANAWQKSSCLPGGIWGGLVPGNLDKLEELAKCGVIGLKAFMSNSGMSDFPAADLTTLRLGMEKAAALGLVVGVHAESDYMTGALAQERLSRGASSIQDYLDSRPIEAELEAIGQALELAEATGCALHVVHVSSAAGVELIHAGKARGIDVTSETCPHYLLLDETDLFRLGAVAKCAPPLRSPAEREKLWESLPLVDTIGSDHSPSPPDLKTSENFFKVWGGISGAQHNFPLFFQAAVLERNLDATMVARLTAGNVAKRFRLKHKGDLKIGMDADMTLLRVGEPAALTSEELLTRHRLSPYTGMMSRVQVTLTLSCGRVAHSLDPAVPMEKSSVRPFAKYRTDIREVP